MERGRYHRTRRGQASMVVKRRWRRFTLMVDQAPQSKNIRPKDAIAFQQELVRQLEATQRAAYTGRVFLQVEFFNKSKTPPVIYKLPKNYLDLMEKPRPDSGITRQSLLFKNDRQVKGLIARYHFNCPFNEPQVWVRAEAFRDFLADVELIDRIRRDDFEDDRRQRSSYGSGSEDFRDGPFQSDDRWDDDDFDRLAEFERERESWLRHLSEDTYQAQLQMMRMGVQRKHLIGTDIVTCRGLLNLFESYPKRKGALHDDMMTRLIALTRNLTIASPMVLELRHAPHRHGDTEAFGTALRAALEDFKKKNRFLFPLYSLMNVTILMVPPEGGGKDLDNLARLILPALHEVWAPPSHIAQALGPGIPGKGMTEYWSAERAALPKEPKHSVTEYRVFEIPRFPDDPKEGFVRLAVGEGFTPVQFREGIDEYLDRWRESLVH